MNLNNTTTPESEQDCAQTPWWFIKSLEDYTFLNIDLDVCCAANTAKADKFYSLEDNVDGLKRGWDKVNYCNPPYSHILPWISHSMLDTLWSGNTTLMLIPDKPEVGYTRLAREHADTVIHMPFRLNFLRPDGTPFLVKEGKHKGKPQGPKFPVCIYIFTPQGLRMPIRDVYHDFRVGFK
jgi:phage N-6-adenine-methyltransferase